MRLIAFFQKWYIRLDCLKYHKTDIQNQKFNDSFLNSHRCCKRVSIMWSIIRSRCRGLRLGNSHLSSDFRKRWNTGERENLHRQTKTQIVKQFAEISLSCWFPNVNFLRSAHMNVLVFGFSIIFAVLPTVLRTVTVSSHRYSQTYVSSSRPRLKSFLRTFVIHLRDDAHLPLIVVQMFLQAHIKSAEIHFASNSSARLVTDCLKVFFLTI